jgi:7-cyano-7-deazaguanine reductase
MFKDAMMPLDNALAKKILPPIETFSSPFAKRTGAPGVIRIVFPEFTCVCPRTGYPDFASIDLYYLPGRLCIELKSWKLYLNSFRMVGAFHESVCAHLFDTIKKLIKPRWLLLAGDFFPRGNVNTTVILEEGMRPPAADFLIKTYDSRARSFSHR